MLKSIRTVIKALLITLILTSTSCQKASIEDNPSEKAKAASVASKYIKAFISGDKDYALELSSAPFWGDGDLISDLDHLKTKLQEQTQDISQANKTSILGTHFLTLEQARVVQPRLYRRLQADKFTDYYPDNVYLVIVLVAFDGRENNGVVLLHEHQGMWKVIGIGD